MSGPKSSGANNRGYGAGVFAASSEWWEEDVVDEEEEAKVAEAVFVLVDLSQRGVRRPPLVTDNDDVNKGRHSVVVVVVVDTPRPLRSGRRRSWKSRIKEGLQDRCRSCIMIVNQGEAQAVSSLRRGFFFGLWRKQQAMRGKMVRNGMQIRDAA